MNQRCTLPVWRTRSDSVQPGQVGTGVAGSAVRTVVTKREVSAATAAAWSMGVVTGSFSGVVGRLGRRRRSAQVSGLSTTALAWLNVSMEYSPW